MPADGSMSQALRLHGLVSELMGDAKFSDAEVRVGDETIPVHRHVIFLEFFFRSLQGGQKEIAKD